MTEQEIEKIIRNICEIRANALIEPFSASYFKKEITDYLAPILAGSKNNT